MNAAPLVLVVAYRCDDHLSACLTGLGPDADVVVVDNGSSGPTRRIVAAAGARYVDAGANLGYAGGVNLGLAEVGGGRDVLLLNPDARIDARGVLALQAALRPARVAAAGPLLVGPDGTPQRASWPLPSPLQVWTDALALSSLWRGRRFVTGAALMLRAEALEQLGGFDERYFLYVEESDWQRRAQQAGWTVRVVPEVTVVHVGAASSPDLRSSDEHAFASWLAYATKWHRGAGLLLMRAGAVVAALRRSLLGSREARARNRWLLRRHLATGPWTAAPSPRSDRAPSTAGRIRRP